MQTGKPTRKIRLPGKRSQAHFAREGDAQLARFKLIRQFFQPRKRAEVVVDEVEDGGQSRQGKTFSLALHLVNHQPHVARLPAAQLLGQPRSRAKRTRAWTPA